MFPDHDEQLQSKMIRGVCVTAKEEPLFPGRGNGVLFLFPVGRDRVRVGLCFRYGSSLLFLRRSAETGRLFLYRGVRFPAVQLLENLNRRILGQGSSRND
jgi:hypothetical protein